MDDVGRRGYRPPQLANPGNLIEGSLIRGIHVGGGHMGVLTAGETAITTTNRNFKGRMGSPGAGVYLGNAWVAAAAAVAGEIIDPAEVLT